MTELALILRATALLVLCFGFLGLCRRRAAALRALILTLTFAALLLLPGAGAVLPSMRVANPVPKVGVAVPRMLGYVAPAPVAVTLVARATAPTPRTPVLLSTASAVLLVWAAGAIAFATHLFVSVWRTTRVRRGFTAWPQGQAMARSILRGRTRVVNVALADRIHAPFAFGVRPATIVFPSDANDWSGDDVRRALLHELEHIRRGDWIVLLGSRLVCTLYWFHPLAWLAWRRLRLEIERACDDAVVRVSEPAAYAEQLVDLASRLSTHAPIPLLSMASRSELASRVTSMLDATQRRNPPTRLPRLLTVGAAALVLVAVAATRVASMPVAQQDARIVAPEKNNMGADVLVDGASVSGYLYDPFGNPVDGVVLDIEWMWFGPPPPGPKEGPFVRNTTTDNAGHFSFEHLRSGFYGLAAPATDFVEAAQFSLEVGEHVDRDLHMKLELLKGSFTVCRDCTMRSATYVVPDSIAREFDLDEKERLTQPITGPEPAGGWLAAHPTIPEYPESLKKTNLEGTVIIEGAIGIDGIRTRMRVVSAPDPALATAALEMLAEEVWKPAYVRSVPVEVPFREEINFVLRLREP
jgi:beta-lactamase regulating signal transducer with metallopeptidase domain